MYVYIILEKGKNNMEEIKVNVVKTETNEMDKLVEKREINVPDFMKKEQREQKDNQQIVEQQEEQQRQEENAEEQQEEQRQKEKHREMKQTKKRKKRIKRNVNLVCVSVTVILLILLIVPIIGKLPEIASLMADFYSAVYAVIPLGLSVLLIVAIIAYNIGKRR